MNALIDKGYRAIRKIGLFDLIPDEPYLKLMFRLKMGKSLDLNNPKTFNEKLQWLKLHDRKPEYTRMVDKYEAKEFIASKIGDEHIIPTLGVWDKFEDIDFSALPDQFVLKTTHDSGGVYICKDKRTLDLNAAKKVIEESLNSNYFMLYREQPYNGIRRRIIAEQYMTDDTRSDEFTDYKFYCFNGNVDCVMVCYDRASGDTKFYFFDQNWNLKRINKRGIEAPAGFSLPKPACIDEMFSLAARLSEGLPFVRVDLYQSCGRVFFGEMTLYPQSGFDPNYLPDTDLYFGNLINLPIG